MPIPAALAAALPIAGPIVGDLLGGMLGARENRKTSQRQMEFQERMRDTQYQAAAKDLEAAGLNRVLALGSPAASPSGAGFSAPTVSPGSSGVAGAQAQTARQTANSTQKLQGVQAENLTANTAFANQQTAKALAEEAKIKADTLLIPLQAEEIKARTAASNSASVASAAAARLNKANAVKAEALNPAQKRGAKELEEALDAIPGVVQSAKEGGQSIVTTILDAIMNPHDEYLPKGKSYIDAKSKNRPRYVPVR